MSKVHRHQEQAGNSQRRSFLASLVFGILGFTGTGKAYARQPGRGRQGRGRGSSDPNWEADHNIIHTLLSNRNQIQRQIKLLPNGVETLTETDNPKLRPILVQHVKAMKKRVEEVRPIHLRDTLFAALFRNAKKVSMKVTETPKGVQVIETSNDPFTIKLIQAHAKVVSLFIKNGHQEVRKNHTVPKH